MRLAQKEAYADFNDAFKAECKDLLDIITRKDCVCNDIKQAEIDKIVAGLKASLALSRKEILSAARKVLRYFCSACRYAYQSSQPIVSQERNCQDTWRTMLPF